MTFICKEPDCPRCSGVECTACSEAGKTIGACTHDPVLRHHGMRAIDKEHPLDSVVVDVEEHPEPSMNRVPTKPMPPLAAKNITFQLDDPTDLVEFFRMSADILASCGGRAEDEVCRVTILVERVPKR